MRRSHALQRRCGAEVTLLPPDDLRARFPGVSVDGVVMGARGRENEGWLDPYALLQGVKRKARSLGAVYVEDEVVDVDCTGGKVSGIKLRHGRAGFAGAPPQTPGVRLHCETDILECPLVIDPSLFENRIWPLLGARVPAFDTIKVTGAWAGLYAYNTVDQNAVTGPHPEVSNFLFANGFSGHGLQQAPAVGRAISELIAFGAFRALDLTRLSFNRLAEGMPLRERNTV